MVPSHPAEVSPVGQQQYRACLKCFPEAGTTQPSSGVLLRFNSGSLETPSVSLVSFPCTQQPRAKLAFICRSNKNFHRGRASNSDKPANKQVSKGRRKEEGEAPGEGRHAGNGSVWARRLLVLTTPLRKWMVTSGQQQRGWLRPRGIRLVKRTSAAGSSQLKRGPHSSDS